MDFPNAGWSNKGGTAARACACGTWRQHWLNFSGQPWPGECSVVGCTAWPTVGAHIVNQAQFGERIAPLCDGCNLRSGRFSLKGGVALPSANQAETCDKRT